MEGSVTIKLPRDQHMILNLSSSGVSGAGVQWQCILCDQKVTDPRAFIRLRCIPERIVTIEVGEPKPYLPDNTRRAGNQLLGGTMTQDNPTPENPPTRQPGTNPKAAPGSWDNPWDADLSTASVAITVNGQMYDKATLEFIGYYADAAPEGEGAATGDNS